MGEWVLVCWMQKKKKKLSRTFPIFMCEKTEQKAFFTMPVEVLCVWCMFHVLLGAVYSNEFKGEKAMRWKWILVRGKLFLCNSFNLEYHWNTKLQLIFSSPFILLNLIVKIQSWSWSIVFQPFYRCLIFSLFYLFSALIYQMSEGKGVKGHCGMNPGHSSTWKHVCFSVRPAIPGLMLFTKNTVLEGSAKQL